MSALIADRALYCDAAQTRLVAEGSTEAAFVVANRAGKEIPKHLADALRLEAGKDGVVKQRESSENKAKIPAENKAVESAPKRVVESPAARTKTSRAKTKA